MKTLELKEHFSIGDALIDGVSVAPLNFVTFAALWQTAHGKISKTSKFEILLQRERMKHQAVFTAAGKRVIPDDAQLLTLPIAIAREVIDNFDVGEGALGKVLTPDANGISSPILYQLGTPIAVDGGKDKKAITEIEFKASTYGDVEDVLAADNQIAQTVELIRKVGRPVEFSSLTSLPSWAIDRITMGDGIMIARNILPNFLG